MTNSNATLTNPDHQTSAFDKARTGLWASLQVHLVTVYDAEKAFTKAVAFTDTFPFSTASVSIDLLNEYWKQKNALRDLFTDETTQLTTLVQTIRTKAYAAGEKRQLFLLLLGYMDVLASVVHLLDAHLPTELPKDDELAETITKFNRLQNFTRLNIKGLPGLLTL